MGEARSEKPIFRPLGYSYVKFDPNGVSHCIHDHLSQPLAISGHFMLSLSHQKILISLFKTNDRDKTK